MTIAQDASHGGWTQAPLHGNVSLQEKFEVLKEIGDGSFGSVALARVRGGGSHVARRGTLVAIKTMKKQFESFAPCLELREIIFLRTLPNHYHLVPALDIFLDPLTKKLHVAMEYMDGNLYQLMKARDHKPLDGSSVKSILFQILSGLEHIHHNGFFHRDVKPENILVSVSAREESGSAFKRYSQLVTPPSTPPSYTIKIADFGLARETHSKLPYTTYVSTRWYRAPEVLLRAGEYSAPVDIWAIGAMAVEIATLKPLFPGSNEVDQVWRVCEIMGSPGNWVNKQGQRVGGGEWKDGVRLAHKLGFSFPRMAPHTLDTILQSPQWPPQLAAFVTWCLMWDPKARPTSTQSLNHPYFTDAFDPLRPKSSRSNLLSRRQQDSNIVQQHQQQEPNTSITSKTSSWFRKSLIARDSAPAVPQVSQQASLPPQPLSPAMSPVKHSVSSTIFTHSQPQRPLVKKRNTWAVGAGASIAPMPILPSIRPISPLSNAVTAQAHPGAEQVENKPPAKKIGRQLSVASNGNHYPDLHRQEAERALNGQSDGISPSSGQKESFFSHLRKRARRLSGRNQLPLSPRYDDIEANNGTATWHSASNRNSMITDVPMVQSPSSAADFAELDRALQNVRNSMEVSKASAPLQSVPVKETRVPMDGTSLKRHSSLTHGYDTRSSGRGSPSPLSGSSASRSIRRGTHKSTLAINSYETPMEQEELLDEALASAHAAMTQMDRQRSHQAQMPYQRANVASSSEASFAAPYPTPSPSAKRNSVGFGACDYGLPTKPIDIHQAKQQQVTGYPFPTPPYEENEWAAAATASIAAAGDHWR